MILTGSFEKAWIQEISKTVGKRGDPIIFHRQSFVCELAYGLSS